MRNNISIVIPTKNRKNDLIVTLKSLLNQSVEHEIIVLDDASSDGTARMVEANYPKVKLIRSEKLLGCSIQRNVGTRLALNSIVISIDDDVEFVDPSTIEQTLNLFDHPRIGAVTIPYINVNSGKTIFQKATVNEDIQVTFSFTGVGYAVRKDIFLKLDGFREILYMEGEESDLSIRMLELGYVVRLGTASPIHHIHSPVRENTLRFIFNRRNHILIPWLNVPTAYFFIHLLGTCINNINFGWQTGRFFLSLKGLAKGFRSIFSEWSSREPVSIKTYRLFRKLRKYGPLPLDEIEDMLPPI